ncbi:MAG: helix-turn-helix transcriptional regulator [Pseudomonadota bacterium]
MTTIGNQAGEPVARRKPSRTKGGPHPIDAHVGARVKFRRMILGMSQEKIAKELGLTFQQIQKYEKGVNRIGAGRLYELSRLLDVPVQFFYDDYDTPIAAAPGMAEDDADEDPLLSLVSSPEGIALCRAFSTIKDPNVRRRVIELVQSIAENEANRQA